MRNKTLQAILVATVLSAGIFVAIYRDVAPVVVSIDGQDTVFQYTDDNTGEDLIILTDQITYTGISRATVRFLVRNESDTDQNVDIGFFFDTTRRKATEVKRLPLTEVREPVFETQCTEPVQKAASSSPACDQVQVGLGPVRYIASVSAPKLENRSLGVNEFSSKLALSNKTRKSVENYVADHKTTDTIAAGEFAVYEAVIEFKGAKDGKFYIEAVGSAGAYGHLDPWYSNAWTYRKKITITGGTSSGTGYQVLLKVGMTSAASGEDFDVGGNSASFPTQAITGNSSGDFRFTDDDGITELDFWVQNVVGSNGTAVAHVWVQVNDDLGSNQDIYIYYGNGGASNASNGANTFELFDSFDDGTIDLSKWSTVCNSGCQHVGGTTSSSMSESGGLLRQLDAAVGGSQSAVNASTTQTDGSAGRAVRARFNRADTGTFANNNLGFNTTYLTPMGTTTPAVGNNNNQNQVYCNGANFTQVQLQASDLVNGTYYMYEARRESTTEIECALYSTDNALLGTEANNVALSPSISETEWPLIRSADGFDQQTDWVFVRKFKETEPVFSSAALQEIVAANNWNVFEINYGEVEVRHGGLQVGR